jgi:hypothetical protein
MSRAAGTSEHAVSKACRAFLENVLQICHSVVRVERIDREWRNHLSPFSSTWLAAMVSQRKAQSLDDIAFESTLAHTNWKDLVSDDLKAIVEKDQHLVAAAVAADSVVTSLDDQARRAFVVVARQDKSIAGVIWINPVLDVALEDWLRGCREPPADWSLGSVS